MDYDANRAPPRNPAPLRRYLPAIPRSVHHSPVDALIALGVPRDEVMELVVASWPAGGPLLAEIDGARPVAAVPLADGRWAACNTYPAHASPSRAEAERRLKKLAKRGHEGLVAEIVADRSGPPGDTAARGRAAAERAGD